MRFRMLKIVTAIIVIVVVTVAVSVSLVRKFVFPAPPGEPHGQVEVIRKVTKA